MQRSIAALALVLTLGLAACTSGKVAVAHDAGDARVRVGQTLVVDFGQTNPSIGDAWFLVTPPDPEVLADRGEDIDSDCDLPGCGGRLTWSFDAVGAGTTTIKFRYCYRSQLANCEPRPGDAPMIPMPLVVIVRT